jgi:hypothetical protein
MRLSERGVDGRFAGVHGAAGQADLASVLRQVVAPQRQRHVQAIIVRVDQEKRGGQSGAGWLLVGLPSLPGRHRRKPPLCHGPWQGRRQPCTQERLDVFEISIGGHASN